MVQLIVGAKGKGKTTRLLAQVNEEVKTAVGNIVYLDKSARHMFELNNRVRLIDVSEYLIDDTDEFLGFVCGIVSQDHDLEKLVVDNIMTIAHIESVQGLGPVVSKLDEISRKFGMDIVLSVAADPSEIPESLSSMVAVAL